MWKERLRFRQTGFTLIELLIVIVIIAALAVAVFISLNPVKRLQDARNAKRVTDIDQIRTAINSYLVDKGTLPQGLSAGMQETQIGTSNGSGTANNPSCYNTSGSCNVTSQSCVDLSNSLVSYLKNIPQDPKIGSASATGYSVSIDAHNIVTVNSCGTENIALSSNPLNRHDLLYGSEIGAWAQDGKPVVDSTTAIPSLLQAAKVPLMRFAQFDCFTDMTCGNDNHTGTETRANFDAAINGIISTDKAIPWIKLVPIANGTIGTINGTVFCPPTSNLASNMPFYKAIVAEAGSKVQIYESTNEGEYDCAAAWGYPSAGSTGVSTILGNHFAANMPALKKYARSLGYTIYTVGYIGTSGGTGWGQTCTTPRMNAVDEFNQAAYQAYVNAGNDPDYIPDAESIHAYPHSSDFPSATDECIFQYFKLFNQQWRAHLISIWGPTIGNQIELSISEWNAGNLSWSGWTDSTTVSNFYTGWFQNVLQGAALSDNSVGMTDRYWNANLFETATDNDYYDIIRADGTTPAWYFTFKNLSITDPNR